MFSVIAFTEKRKDEKLTREMLENMRNKQERIDIIRRGENVDEKEAEQMLKDWGLY